MANRLWKRKQNWYRRCICLTAAVFIVVCTFILPAAAMENDGFVEYAVSGNEGVGSVSGNEGVGSVSGNEDAGSVSGNEDAGSVSGNEGVGSVSGNEDAGSVSGNEGADTVSGSDFRNARLTDPSGSIDGTQYHSTEYPYYQVSSHLFGGDYDMTVFLLASREEYDAGDWAPTPVKDWTAKAASNYILAYCADGETYSSGSGADYKTYTLDNSRFTSDEQRRTLAGIIGHSYPFISADEMQEQLTAAYQAGTIDRDVSDCTEAEFIIATQWAIWETNSLWIWWDEEDPGITNVKETITNEDGTTVEVDSFPDYQQQRCLNPLTDPGHPEGEVLTEHVRAIKNWLLANPVPEKLQAADYDYTVEQADDGSCTLIVNVTLNRPVQSDEYAQYGLTIGGKSAAVRQLTAGSDTFRVEIGGLTEEELGTARVNLTVSGEQMQAYFFDSPYYQDLIGGNWEYYANDLSFDIGEKTTVSVTKAWAEEDHGIDSVKVQLLADGAPYGETVTLKEANNWYHEWADLLEYDLSNREIVYTVQEEPVSGYHSTVQKIEKGENTKTVKMWKEAEHFTDGKEYLLVSRSGAFSYNWHAVKESYRATWSPPDLGSTDPAANQAIWVAEEDSTTGGFFLTHKATGKKLYGTSLFYFGDSSRPFYFEGGYFYTQNGSSVYYFEGHEAGGSIVATTDRDQATMFTLYELTDVNLGNADTNFLVTNISYDQSGYTLPETGGDGIFLYIQGGLGLMTAAVTLLHFNFAGRGKRKE